MALAISSLPVPLSPCSRTVERLGATWRHEVKNLQHGLAFAHDVLEVVALLQGALELNVFFFRVLAGDGGAHIGQQLFVVPWLLDEIGCPRLHGVDRILHRAVGGDHDDRMLRMWAANLGEHVHAIAVGQSQVEQHEIEGALADLGQAVSSAGGDCDGVAFELQQGLERFADCGLVVNDEDTDRAARGGRSGALRRGMGATSDDWLASDMDGLPAGSAGKSRVKVVPSPGRLSTRILPACSWMMP